MGMGEGGAGGKEEETLGKKLFLVGLFFFNFLIMAIDNFKQFLILWKYTSQVWLSGTLVIQAQEHLGKAGL